MEKPLISVIVPVYKVEPYINRCVESIVNQTYKNLEIILVDDGSPDNCPKMCDEWAEKDNRIKVIHKQNGGVSSARNEGIANSNGEYISFVDSDDWITKDYIEHMIGIIFNNNVDAVTCGFNDVNDFCGFDALDKNGELIEIIDNKDIMGNMDKGLCYLCGKIYNKILFNDVPKLPEDISVSEDMMLNYFIYKNCSKIAVTNLEMYYYFRHSESVLSGKITYRIIDDSMRAYKIIDEDYDKVNESYPDFIYNKVMNDYFLLNSIIRNNACRERYSVLRKDILSYKDYIFGRKCRREYEFRHKLGTALLMLSPRFYDLSVIIRKRIRGY